MTGERVWTVRDALDWTRGYLADKGADAPRRSAEWLLSAATGLSRVELYTQFERPLSDPERALLREGVRRRAAGEPLQYVTGEMPFRHLVVRVRPGVLIPRPETEVLVDEALKELRSGERATGRPDAGGPTVVDLCTGSGCIALSIAQEVPDARVWATDLSPLACEVARANAERLGLSDRVAVAQGDLFAALPAELHAAVDLVIANPPYIPSADLPDLPQEVQGFEPHLALDGGEDGLLVARRLWTEARQWLAPGGVLALELDEGRVCSEGEEIVEWYEQVRVAKDLAGKDRVLIGTAKARDGERQR